MPTLTFCTRDTRLTARALRCGAQDRCCCGLGALVAVTGQLGANSALGRRTDAHRTQEGQEGDHSGIHDLRAPFA